MKRMTGIAAVTALCLAVALSLTAQVETNTSTAATGKSTKTTTVENGEVVLVSGNDLVVKMADGTIRHFKNVPDSARVTVDGQQLGIHDLKPGMKLQRTITTTSRLRPSTKCWGESPSQPPATRVVHLTNMQTLHQLTHISF